MVWQARSSSRKVPEVPHWSDAGQVRKLPCSGAARCKVQGSGLASQVRGSRKVPEVQAGLVQTRCKVGSSGFGVVW